MLLLVLFKCSPIPKPKWMGRRRRHPTHTVLKENSRSSSLSPQSRAPCHNSARPHHFKQNTNVPRTSPGKVKVHTDLKGTCLAMHLTCMKYRIVLEGPRRFPGASSDGRHPSPSEQPHVQISFANQLASPGFELYSCGIAESICPPVPDSFCSKFQTCLWASHDLGEIPCLRMGLCLLFTLTSFQNSSHNIPRSLPGPGFRHIP